MKLPSLRTVKYGSDLLFNPELRQQVLGVTGVATQIAGVVTQIVVDVSNELKSSQEKEEAEAVVFEVQNDINAFEEYLRYAIFGASGFESYCIQELKGLVDSFRDKEGTWTGVALNEWLQGNSILFAEIPDKLKSKESNLEVSEGLRQLSIALKRSRS